MDTDALLRFNPESQVIEVWLGDHWQELATADGEGDYDVFRLSVAAHLT